MTITLKEIAIREIVQNYVDNDEDGVVGFGGKLNIRPKYQREFVYDDKKRNAVIDTILKGFPLNVMYWVKNEDGTFELLDGQQRTVSFCRYFDNKFSFNEKAFHNLPQDIKEKFLDYKCMIYVCEGTESEKLEWFKIINIAGEKLTDQELRNAMYTGQWLTDAKRHFSKTNCAGYNLGKDYISGECNRQFYLETALDWIRENQNLNSIEKYMSIHQHDTNCNELWLYYLNVINWIQTLFPHVRKEMKGLPWGHFYNKYRENEYDATAMESKIKSLLIDDEVTSKKGIYEYLLSGEEKYLNLRCFTESQRQKAYDKQSGKCPRCLAMNKPTKNKIWKIEEMEADHITPWHLGGKTVDENCQMLCKTCNREKSGH